VADHELTLAEKQVSDLASSADVRPLAGAKIERVDAITCTFRDTLGQPLHLCLVRIEADGLIGWGEICDSYCCTFPELYRPLVEQLYAPQLLGHELTTVEVTSRRLRLSARRRVGDAGMAVQALSGVELALWDLYGKVRRASVSTLIGRVRDRVPVYASGKHLDQPLAVHVEILAPAIERGVRTVKVRSSLDPESDLRLLGEVREALPGSVTLLLDGNEHFSVATALRLARRLGDFGVAAFEEPIPQVYRRAIATLVRQSPLPIAYGEHLFGAVEFGDALAAGWPDVVQPDPSIAGGLSECLRVADIAEAHGTPVMPHSSAGPISLAASLHLAAARQNVHRVEQSVTLEPIWETLVGGRLSVSAIRDGTLAVPDEPGLGVEIDEAALRAHPYRPTPLDTKMPRRSIGVL
jgi:L-alanine-DL-glutamate epimerase-like enolase superfamily enzyme